MSFTSADVPDLGGKTIAITGANSGIGFEAARAFARRGADVVLACRSPERAESARARLLTELPQAKLEIMALDLASLRSVRDFAQRLLDSRASLHVLVNNAGLMAIPRMLTADGFEMQLGVNHFAHFALTGLLLPRLLAMPGARVVNVSSMASALGKMSFEDLDGSSAYSKWAAYAQSKLANLLFTFELAQRLGDRRAELRSIACHPGYAATNLQYVGPELEKSRSARIVMELGNNLLAQSAEQGALPTVFASVSPEAHSGEFIGPSGLLRRGPPKPGKAPRAAYDRASMQKLWQISSERTGVGFDALS